MTVALFLGGNLEIKPRFPALQADSLPSETLGKPFKVFFFFFFKVLKAIKSYVFQKTSLSVANEHISKQMTMMNISEHDEKREETLSSTWVSIW